MSSWLPLPSPSLGRFHLILSTEDVTTNLSEDISARWEYRVDLIRPGKFFLNGLAVLHPPIPLYRFGWKVHLHH